MRGEYRDLLSEYKNVKTEYNQLKLKHTELKGDMADCRDQLNKLDIQNAKLTNKCEVGIPPMICDTSEINVYMSHLLGIISGVCSCPPFV